MGEDSFPNLQVKKSSRDETSSPLLPDPRMRNDLERPGCVALPSSLDIPNGKNSLINSRCEGRGRAKFAHKLSIVHSKRGHSFLELKLLRFWLSEHRMKFHTITSLVVLPAPKTMNTTMRIIVLGRSLYRKVKSLTTNLYSAFFHLLDFHQYFPERRN